MDYRRRMNISAVRFLCQPVLNPSVASILHEVAPSRKACVASMCAISDCTASTAMLSFEIEWMRRAAPHTFPKLPVTLHAAPPGPPDARIEVEAEECCATKNGPRATACIPSVVSEFTQHDGLPWIVSGEQLLQSKREDKRIVIEQNHPLDLAADESR